MFQGDDPQEEWVLERPNPFGLIQFRPLGWGCTTLKLCYASLCKLLYCLQ